MMNDAVVVTRQLNFDLPIYSKVGRESWHVLGGLQFHTVQNPKHDTEKSMCLETNE